MQAVCAPHPALAGFLPAEEILNGSSNAINA
jgi:hypothetical protein